MSSDYLICLYCEENLTYNKGQYLLFISRVESIYHNVDKQSAVYD